MQKSRFTEKQMVAILRGLRTRMLGWRYSGFSVHNPGRVAASDADGRK